MAYQFSVNLTPTTGAAALVNLKARMIAAGWVIKASGDGLSAFSSTADTLTNGAASGANGVNNSRAWFRIQGPGGTRELCIQYDASRNMRIKYSASAKFTGGTPSATQTPTATDEQIIAGGGTDASPTYVNMFPTDGSYVQQVCCDNASPYPFYTVTYPNGGGTPNSGFMMDAVDGSAPGDADTVIFYRGTGNSTAFTTSSLTNNSVNPLSTGGFKAYLKKGLAGEGFVDIPACSYANNQGTCNASTGTSGGVTNPHSGSDDVLPVVYYRQATATPPQGYKGVSRMLRWQTNWRSTPNTIDTPVTKGRITIGDITLPWDGTTTPA